MNARRTSSTRARFWREVSGADVDVGGDGEIKAPGPFGSMALMVLKKNRDLDRRSGPGFQGFFSQIKGLSGTWVP
jgi:hypothetical protein